MKKTKADTGGRKAKVKKQSQPRDTRDRRDTRRGAKPAARLPEPLLKPFNFTGWGYKTPALGVAEARAQRHDEGAAYFDTSEREALAGGNAAGAARLAELAKDERERAIWWRALMGADEDAKRSGDEWRRIADEHIDVLLARAEKDEGAMLNLSLLLGQLHSGLHALAAHGRKWAARLLANSLHEAVGSFELLATAKPELFREWARGAVAIPGHISRNKEKQADNQRLLKQLEQGEACRFAILPTGKRGKKWKFQDRANALAVRLVNHIEHGRTCYELHKLQAQHAGRELPGWLHEAMKLEPFSAKPKTWQAWARVAWQVLTEISPNGKPEEHDAFFMTETEICNVRVERTGGMDYHSPSDAPSVAKEDIREALFGAFELVATGASQRTKRRRKASPDK